jgi:DMSO reductase family type II enzyme heme b subunit
MLKKVLWKSVVLVSVVVAILFYFNNRTLSQGSEEPVAKEENIPTKEFLTVKYLPLETKYADKAFEQVDPLNIILQKQDKAIPHGGGSIKEIEIRGFHNGETIFFRLAWDDATNDERAIKPQQYRDAVAMMFPLDIVTISPETPFSPRMGDRAKPVNLWHWKADWEKELHLAGGYEHIEDEYLNMFDDFASNPHPVKGHSDLYASASLVSGGRASGTLLAKPDRGRSVEDLNAIGFGTLTSQVHQDVKGKGDWADEKWSVVIYRPLITPDKNDVQFVPGMGTFFNVAVWNGAQGDINGQKSISIRWRPLKIERVKYQE